MAAKSQTFVWTGRGDHHALRRWLLQRGGYDAIRTEVQGEIVRASLSRGGRKTGAVEANAIDGAKQLPSQAFSLIVCNSGVKSLKIRTPNMRGTISPENYRKSADR